MRKKTGNVYANKMSEEDLLGLLLFSRFKNKYEIIPIFMLTKRQMSMFLKTWFGSINQGE